MAGSIQRRSVTVPDGHIIKYTTLGHTSHPKPILVFFVGSAGLGAFFHRLATHMSSAFVCVYFDRRGFSEKTSKDALTGAVTSPETLISQQADDAAYLIETIKRNTTAPVHCFATSFGATIALELVIRHSRLIDTVVLHEPILPTLLPKSSPEREKIMRAFAAMPHSNQPFNILAGALFGQDAEPLTKGNDFWSQAPEGNLRSAVNEAVAANLYQPGVEDIERVAGQLVLMGSVESKDKPVYRMVEALSQRLPVSRRQIRDMVGGHFSFAGKFVKDAAACIVSILRLEGQTALGRGKTKI